MRKLYEKNELTFAIVWIVVYCVLQSLANPLNEKIGIEYSASAVLCILQAVFLFAFIKRNGLLKRYGLCKSAVPARRFLYYIPLMILATGNLWNGVAVNYTLMGVICRIAGMLCVGFVEEVIFRGFLFKAMEKDGVESAINSLSTFANEAEAASEKQVVQCLILIVITVAYTLFLRRFFSPHSHI